MPKRLDIESVLIIGSGPIVIGQGCEFDYSGVQACRALKKQGFRVVLVNSNPATIMTDPDLVDATYIEPITWQILEKIIDKERPDAILPTMGGQTALNCALDLAEQGVLDIYNVELIGASRESILKAEDRDLFKKSMQNIGLKVAKSGIAKTIEEALQLCNDQYPVILRPSFTLGGSGGGIAYNRAELISLFNRAQQLSATQEVLIEESLVGWKEFEMEVIRDTNDNCIIVCSIENLDPMGVHTGDSITVAPAQTLSDPEYQQMRTASLEILREIGVATGGANVQFAVEPKTGRQIVIEMNPRVSRSSALASKATGFPIAKVAALLAVGFTLDELSNEITGGVIPASFEPTIDYVVTKIPRFNFEKFPKVDTGLTTQMKSVGEVMAVAPSFKASLQKGLSSLELGFTGLDSQLEKSQTQLAEQIQQRLKKPTPERILHIADAFRCQFTLQQVNDYTGIDPWFLRHIEELVATEKNLQQQGLRALTKLHLTELKWQGFTDARLANILNLSEHLIRSYRYSLGLRANFRRIDSCSAEFPAETAYLYSCFADTCEAKTSKRKKVIVLGSGPNRIGQGIEFDYCCVQAIFALRDSGFESIMVNCNPETVSTDYDIADRLYFEPLTLEAVMDIIQLEKPDGVVVQFGGQTPLKLARTLSYFGVNILGTDPDAIDLAEDRSRFAKLTHQLGLQQPASASVTSVEEGVMEAKRLGFPLMVRPSYVLGGRAMEVVYNLPELQQYLARAVKVSDNSPVLLDRYLEDATEVDVDAIADKNHKVFVAGVLEHIEQAGVHSGDSSCCLPPHSLMHEKQLEIHQVMQQLAQALRVEGLMNAQFAIKDGELYILEVNPRASRTIPFVSKAIGKPLSKIALKCMLGTTLETQKITHTVIPQFFSVKKPVFPFAKFIGCDPILGPEMKSTGEAMGIGKTFAEAYGKGMLATQVLPNLNGRVFISVRDVDKPKAVDIAQGLIKLGFEIIATKGTACYLRNHLIACRIINKVQQGSPHIVDLIQNGEINFIVNTTEGKRSIEDSHEIRCAAVIHGVKYTTTISGAQAILCSLEYRSNWQVNTLQDLHHEVEVIA